MLPYLPLKLVPNKILEATPCLPNIIQIIGPQDCVPSLGDVLSKIVFGYQKQLGLFLRCVFWSILVVSVLEWSDPGFSDIQTCTWEFSFLVSFHEFHKQIEDEYIQLRKRKVHGEILFTHRSLLSMSTLLFVAIFFWNVTNLLFTTNFPPKLTLHLSLSLLISSATQS